MQQEQENFNTRALLLEEKHGVTIKEKELLHNQVANQNSFMEKLTSENEKLMSHRDLLEAKIRKVESENLALIQKIRTNEKFISEILFNKNMESNIIIPALVQKYDELNESLNHQIAENEKLQASNIEKTRDLNFCIQRITELDEEAKLISSVNTLRHSLSEKARVSNVAYIVM